MVIKVPIEVTQTGTGIKATVIGLEQVERKAKAANDATRGFSSGLASSPQRAGAFADSVGRVSTTLARSADAFGLPAGALRSLDDVMDVAELGFGNLTKAAAGFNAASVGVAGAGLAIGTAIGSWLNTFPAVQRVADSLFHSVFRLVGLAGEVRTFSTSHKDFSATMGASNEQALMKQVQAMRDQGKSTKEIADFYKGALNPELAKRLGLTKEAVAAEEKILKANQKQRDELSRIKGLLSGNVSLEERVKESFSSRKLMADVMMPGLATSIADRTTVTAQAPNLMGQLMGGGIATTLDIGLFKTWELEKESKEKAAAAGEQLIGTLGTLSQQLTSLSQSVGGVAGKILGLASSLSSGLGGVLSGLQGFKQAGKAGGILGILGKVSSSLGIVGSVVGAVGGIIGGIKSLFGGKSKEQKAAEEAARRQAEADRKAAEEEKKRVQVEGLKSARSAAESLMDRMASGTFSEKLTASFGTLIGKVQEALLKSGLGFMATPGLRESKEFMGAQGAASDVAQLIAGMRDAGMIDQGLLQAAGASAEELRAQAVAAAEAAGMEPAEATRAGFGAIAPLLREQLNAAIASGQELDANTKALIEEAKKNGVTILADPMVESVAVQKDMLRELRSINNSGGGSPDVGFASGTRGLRLVKRDMLAKIHEGEGLLVVPRDEMGRTAFHSFARGTDSERGGDLGDWRRDRTGSGTSTSTSTSTSSSPSEDAGFLDALASKLAEIIQPAVTITNAPQVQIVDNSVVRTVEGQKRFERETVSAVEKALDQNARGLESRIERIARRAVA